MIQKESHPKHAARALTQGKCLGKIMPTSATVGTSILTVSALGPSALLEPLTEHSQVSTPRASLRNPCSGRVAPDDSVYTVGESNPAPFFTDGKLRPRQAEGLSQVTP